MHRPTRQPAREGVTQFDADDQSLIDEHLAADADVDRRVAVAPVGAAGADQAPAREQARVAERIDLAIRFAGSSLENADVVARAIGRSPVVLVASSRFLATVSLPERPDDLDPRLCLGMGDTTGVRAWSFRGPDGAEVRVKPQPRFLSDSMVALREAAVAGLGFAQVPRSACFDHLAAGRLVALLPDWAPEPGVAGCG